MRRVKLADLKGGEIIGKFVVDVHERRLLNEGTRYNLSYTPRLMELGIESIYIDDDVSKGLSVKEMLSEHTRLEVKALMNREVLKYTRRSTVDTTAIYKAATSIIEDVLNTDCIYELHDIRLKDEYLLSHSMNVAVLSAIVGINAGMEKDKIQSMVAGSLLHDMGKVCIPDEILNKDGKLTDDEFAEIKKHPSIGYEMIKENVSTSPITKVVVLMHHEKFNGTGYPLGLGGGKIHDTAKIVGICDVFDALISNRSYRQAWPIFEAVEYIRFHSGTQFDPDWVQMFIKSIASYPVGTMVILSNNDVGIVAKQNKDNLLRPQIRLLYNREDKTKLYNGKVINLMKELNVSIVKEL